MGTGDAATAPPAEAATFKVAVVDDEPGVLTAVSRVLARAGFEVASFPEPTAARDALLEGSFAAAVLDVMLPQVSGLELLQQLKARRPELAVVMMTASTSVETAVAALKAGAFDYLTKPFDSLEKIPLVVLRACEHHRLIDRNRRLEEMLEAKEGFEELRGQSDKMREVFRLIEAVSGTDATVLIRGETGTGKELVARAIHRRSERSKKPFNAINCSALTESVLESELFGHVKGAFTGALSARKGLFEASHGGTIFLDEIGDVSPQVQVRLLRVLQEGEVKPIGSNASVAVDVRVIAATHVDLEDAMKKKRFREDLFYRLNVVAIPLPPLRERPDDVLLLANHFLGQHAARMKREVKGFSDEALRALTTHDWPGNVRELENAIARAVVLCTTGQIDAAHLPSGTGGRVSGSDVEANSLSHLSYADAKKAALVAFEKSYLTAKLREAGGNISQAARAAGVDRSNFKRLLREYAVESAEE